MHIFIALFLPEEYSVWFRFPTFPETTCISANEICNVGMRPNMDTNFDFPQKAFDFRRVRSGLWNLNCALSCLEVIPQFCFEYFGKVAAANFFPCHFV